MNCRGLRDVIKRRAIFNYYRTRGNILCLQETHSTISDELIWKAEWGGDAVFSHGESNARGVCILMPKGMTSQEDICNVKRDLEGRVIVIEVRQDMDTISLVNIYAPNKDTPIFFDNLNRMLRVSAERKIVVGDFNLVMDSNVDRIGSTHNNSKSLEILKEMCAELLLSEI